MNKYNFEHIDKLRIHELRDFARKLGVSSPTTLKKEELIDKIISIVEVDQDSNNNDNKYVKTNKEVDFFSLLVSDNSDVIDSLLADDKVLKNIESSDKTGSTMIAKANSDIKYSTFEDSIRFSFSLRQNEAKYGREDIYNLQGYVDIHPTGYGILRHDGFIPSGNDAYLTKSLVKKHKLRKGDYIECKAKIILEDKPKVVFEITKLGNNQKKLCNYDELEYNGIGENYYINKYNMEIQKGERVYIENMPIVEALELSKHITEENAASIKFINIKSRPEDNYKSLQKLDIISIPFNKSEIEVVNTVELVLERIKREFEVGKQNILVIYNFCELIRIFNTACEGFVDFNKINSKAINKIYNILYSSKYVNDNLCSSVICVDGNGIPRDLRSLMELELKPLFNKVFENIVKK